MNPLFEKYEAFIFDLDGTVYRGSHLIPDADKAINRLKELNKKMVFISNKTTGSVRDYYEFLSDGGLNISENEIVNATVVIKKYLQKNFPGKTFYAIAEKIFIDEISESGMVFSENPEEIEIIIITLDRTLSYSKLEVAARALENGAKFFAANIDDTCPVDDGEVLDAGSTISALEKRTHRKLELHFGKPSKFMFEEIKNNLESDLTKTDIALGAKFGIDTALVSTGVKHFFEESRGFFGINGNHNSNGYSPTYHINSIADLVK